MKEIILMAGLLAPAIVWGYRCKKAGRENFHEEIALFVLLAAIPAGAGIYYGAEIKEEEMLRSQSPHFLGGPVGDAAREQGSIPPSNSCASAEAVRRRA